MSNTFNFGDERVSPEEKTRRVGGVFTSVARNYDLMNDLMSGGMHRLWKDRFVAKVKPRAGEQILDMAGGTGDIAFRLAERGAEVTVADINQEMLDVGLERKIVAKSGSYFSFGDERLGQGRQNATAFLTENPDLVQSILARIQADAGPEQVVSARLLPTTDQPATEVMPVVEEEVPAEV